MWGSCAYSVDGVSLETLAWGVEAVESRQAVPAVRTADEIIPGRHGVVTSVAEAYEAPDVVLRMWVYGSDPDGTIPAGTARAVYERNLAVLLNLLSNRHRPLTLTRRMGDGSEHEARARVVQAIVPTQVGRNSGRMSVMFQLVDSFWRDTIATIATLYPVKNQPIEVPGLSGTADIADAVLVLAGPTDTKPRVTDAATGSWVELSRPLATGETWTVDCAAFTSTVGGVRVPASRALPHRMLEIRSDISAVDAAASETVMPTPRVHLTVSSTCTSLTVTAKGAHH